MSRIWIFLAVAVAAPFVADEFPGAVSRLGASLNQVVIGFSLLPPPHFSVAGLGAIPSLPGRSATLGVRSVATLVGSRPPATSSSPPLSTLRNPSSTGAGPHRSMALQRPPHRRVDTVRPIHLADPPFQRPCGASPRHKAAQPSHLALPPEASPPSELSRMAPPREASPSGWCQLSGQGPLPLDGSLAR